VLAVIGRVVELRERIRPTRAQDSWVPEGVEAASIGVQAG
jgi:hypothetical protein